MTSGNNREVMCCGASSWCKVIAWIQIVLYSTNCVFYLAAGLYVFLYPEEWKPDDFNMPYIPMIIIFILGDIFIIIGITFGVLLLQGINQKKPSYLKAWVIFAALSLIWTVSCNVIMPFCIIAVFRLLIEIAMYTFGMWVVLVAKKEMESDFLPSTRPAAYFNEKPEFLPKYDVGQTKYAH